MKRLYTLPILALAFVLFLNSCDNEEAPVVEVPQTSLADRKILNTIFRENPGNTLQWDTTETNLRNWPRLVITEDGNVSGLYLDDKGLTVLPEEIGDLEHLTFLDVKENALTSLPAEIEKLTKLTQLNASYNNLTAVPVGIKELKALEFLALHHNKLSSIPSSIGELTGLRWLYLHNNQLTAIPVELSNLKVLESLAIHNNNITSLPQVVCDWAITTLTLSFHVDEDVLCE